MTKHHATEVKQCRNCYAIKALSDFPRHRGGQCKQCLSAKKIEYKAKFRQKLIAKELVRTAVRNGSVARQPCEKCGKGKAAAHHDDYAFPLSVRWLCQSHHQQWHSEHGEGKNGETRPDHTPRQPDAAVEKFDGVTTVTRGRVCVLSDSDVELLRKLRREQGTNYTVLAKRFGISQSQANKIARGVSRCKSRPEIILRPAKSISA